MIVDVNVLLYAADRTSPFHAQARLAIAAALNGPRGLQLAWIVAVGFVRIASNPRYATEPLSPSAAWGFVGGILARPGVHVVHPGPAHAGVFGALVVDLQLRGNLVTDAHLAAIAIEHDLELVSADKDFARFPALRWTNPFTR